MVALVVISISTPVAGSATAQTDSQDQPTATVAAPSTHRERLNVRIGQTAAVTGSALAGRTVVLERRSAGRWRALDHARVGPTGRYHLRYRAKKAASAQVRVRVAGTTAARRARMNVYRRANASWYGPGLYGNHLACGGRLSAATRGVAHKTLPCGTRVTLRKGDRIVRTRVVDRGPFAGDREFDLTAAVKESLGFGSTGSVDVSL
jgi:rare lipoprotein A (peptidoglycan hydrolase)